MPTRNGLLTTTEVSELSARYGKRLWKSRILEWTQRCYPHQAVVNSSGQLVCVLVTREVAEAIIRYRSSPPPHLGIPKSSRANLNSEEAKRRATNLLAYLAERRGRFVIGAKMATALGYHWPTVRKLLRVLTDMGLVEPRRRRWLSYRISQEGMEWLFKRPSEPITSSEPPSSDLAVVARPDSP